MPDATLTIVAALGSYLGFVFLALAQERHWRAVCAVPARRVRAAWPVAAGLTLQLLALVLTVGAHGPSFGSLLWAVMVSSTAMAVAFTLAWQPRWLRPTAQLLRDRTVRTPGASSGTAPLHPFSRPCVTHHTGELLPPKNEHA